MINLLNYRKIQNAMFSKNLIWPTKIIIRKTYPTITLKNKLYLIKMLKTCFITEGYPYFLISLIIQS